MFPRDTFAEPRQPPPPRCCSRCILPLQNPPKRGQAPLPLSSPITLVCAFLQTISMRCGRPNDLNARLFGIVSLPQRRCPISPRRTTSIKRRVVSCRSSSATCPAAPLERRSSSRRCRRRPGKKLKTCKRTRQSVSATPSPAFRRICSTLSSNERSTCPWGTSSTRVASGARHRMEVLVRVSAPRRSSSPGEP